MPLAIGAAIVVGLVVFVLAVTGVFGGGDGPRPAPRGSGPESAVRTLLDGTIAQNTEQVQSALCPANHGYAAGLLSLNVRSYTVDRVVTFGPRRARVFVTLHLSQIEPESEGLPVLLSGSRQWQVCPAAAQAGGFG